MGKLYPFFRGSVVLVVATGVLVSLVSAVWLFPIQSVLVLYFSLFLQFLVSFLTFKYAHESYESAEILVHNR